MAFGGFTPRREEVSAERVWAAEEEGRLAEPFTAKRVNGLLGIGYARQFLPRPRIDNPGGESQHLVCVSVRADMCRLKDG